MAAGGGGEQLETLRAAVESLQAAAKAASRETSLATAAIDVLKTQVCGPCLCYPRTATRTWVASDQRPGHGRVQRRGHGSPGMRPMQGLGSPGMPPR